MRRRRARQERCGSPDAARALWRRRATHATRGACHHRTTKSHSLFTPLTPNLASSLTSIHVSYNSIHLSTLFTKVVHWTLLSGVLATELWPLRTAAARRARGSIAARRRGLARLIRRAMRARAPLSHLPPGVPLHMYAGIMPIQYDCGPVHSDIAARQPTRRRLGPRAT